VEESIGLEKAETRNAYRSKDENANPVPGRKYFKKSSIPAQLDKKKQKCADRITERKKGEGMDFS
jgi:hypothetical protein